MGWIEAMLTVAYPYMDYLAEEGQWIETSSAIDSSRWRWMWLFFKKRLDNFNNRSLFLSLSLYVLLQTTILWANNLKMQWFKLKISFKIKYHMKKNKLKMKNQKKIEINQKHTQKIKQLNAYAY